MRDGWVQQSLLELVALQNGYPFKPSDLGDEGLPVVRIKELMDPSIPMDRSTTPIPQSMRIESGDTIFSWSGRLEAVVWDRGPALLNQHLFKVTPQHPGVLKEFVLPMLQNLIPTMHVHGSTMKHITKRELARVQVPLPPIEEQRRIVDLMSHVDEAISDGRKEVEGLERYHWSLAESLISSAEGFEVRLGTVSSIVRGGSPRPIDGYYTDDPDGLPWVRIGDVAADGKYITNTEKRIDRSGLSKTRTVAPGDFVLSNSMSFGRPYIVELHGCIHDGWLKISDYEDTFTSDFLYYLLRSQRVQDQFESRAAGSGVRNLKKESVGATVVTAPALDYQKEATRVLSTVATHVATTTDALSLLQELRRGLLESLLSGQREIPTSYDEFIRDGGAA